MVKIAIAGIGSIVIVKGNNKATPVVAFNPGKAPTRTPPRVAANNSINKYGSANANNPFKSASILFTHTIN